MKKTLKKIGVFLLCFAVIAAFMPLTFSTTTYADDISLDDYTSSGDISSAGINLDDYADYACWFSAGSGYVLWDPDTLTLTLYNAEITAEEAGALITLPDGAVTIVLEGDSYIENTYDEEFSGTLIIAENYPEIIYESEIIQQGDSEVNEENSITITGDGTLTTDQGEYDNMEIYTNGTLIFNSGTITADSGILCNDLKMTDGTLVINDSVYILNDLNISGGTIITTEDAGGFLCLGQYNQTGGTVLFSSGSISGIILSDKDEFNYTGGEFQGALLELDLTSIPYTYSTTYFQDTTFFQYSYNESDSEINISGGGAAIGAVDSGYIAVKMTIEDGVTLTVPAEGEFDIYYTSDFDISDYLTNNGSIVNNGEVYINTESGMTDEALQEIVEYLDLTGAGYICVYNYDADSETYYTNDGELMTVVDMSDEYLDFSDGTNVTGDGYSFTGDSENGYTLTIDDNLYIDGDLILPDDASVTINITSSSYITGEIVMGDVIIFGEDYYYEQPYSFDLTITGGGNLKIGESYDLSISGGNNGDTVTITGGTSVVCSGSISIGASGNADGIVNISGEGTTVDVYNYASYSKGIGTGSLTIDDGAVVTVHANQIGVLARNGDITVSNNSSLTTGCEYGLYIFDGSLIVDDTSLLTTNASIASFCIIDNTNSKTQSELISLPYLPDGTEIASVTGTNEYYGYTYWTLISTGSTLSVSQENNEPVFLSGAVSGLIVYAEIIVDNDTNNDTTTETITGATTETSTTASATEDTETTSAASVSSTSVTNNTTVSPSTADDSLQRIIIFSMCSVIASGLLLYGRTKKNLNDMCK